MSWCISTTDALPSSTFPNQRPLGVRNGTQEHAPTDADRGKPARVFHAASTGAVHSTTMLSGSPTSRHEHTSTSVSCKGRAVYAARWPLFPEPIGYTAYCSTPRLRSRFHDLGAIKSARLSEVPALEIRPAQTATVQSVHNQNNYQYLLTTPVLLAEDPFFHYFIFLDNCQRQRCSAASDA